jgi:hypothetical protein
MKYIVTLEIVSDLEEKETLLAIEEMIDPKCLVSGSIRRICDECNAELKSVVTEPQRGILDHEQRCSKDEGHWI